MKYRDGMLAFAFLTVAGVIAVAMVTDPRGFSIRDWQTLLAAFVALGAATLAYQAAMSKVDFESGQARRAERKSALDLALKLQFDLIALEQQAAKIAERIPSGFEAEEPKIISLSKLYIVEPPAYAEAWNKLSIFPISISVGLCEIKRVLHRIERFAKEDGDHTWHIASGEDVPDVLREHRYAYTHLANASRQTLESLNDMADQLYDD